MTKVISFPHMGDYHVIVKYFLSKITKSKIIVPPPITKKTIALGSKYSPDFVCSPFKYNLGNYIESLDQGANVILQAGGGCRYGYYAELQEKILRELGYDFEFVNFIKNNHVSIFNIYKFAKKTNKKLNVFTYFHYLLTSLLMLFTMDSLDKIYRKNIGFEVNKNDFNKTKKEFLVKISQNPNKLKLIYLYLKYKRKYKRIKINKPKNCLKIILVGELYSIMEPYSSNNIEIKLAQKGIEIKRFTNLTYLLIFKKFNIKRLLIKARKYIKYPLGADGTESVSLSLKYAKKGYDGIVHIKSFGCTPEINAMPILSKIGEKYNIPILYFSFDSQDNEVGINTRLEAFYDMLISKKANN